MSHLSRCNKHIWASLLLLQEDGVNMFYPSVVSKPGLVFSLHNAEQEEEVPSRPKATTKGKPLSLSTKEAE
jgi:hypothetical protein